MLRMGPITSILPCPPQPDDAELHPGQCGHCLRWGHPRVPAFPLLSRTTAVLLWLFPDSASADLRMNPANTFLIAEGTVQVAAVAIPSGATQTTFLTHMIRQHSLQP